MEQAAYAGMDDGVDKHDPNVVITAAQDKLANGDLEGGQLVFQSALLDWVDDARENTNNNNFDALQEAVGTLWIAYAHFLTQAKQFKSASQAYDQAIACPIAGSMGRVYLDYARYSIERNKIHKAQEIYLKALVGGKNGQQAAVRDEQDQALLWQEFLAMMQESNPSLTMQSLREAVEAEQSTEAAAAAAADASSQNSNDNESSMQTTTHNDFSPAAKRVKTSDGPEPEQQSKTYVITRDTVEQQGQQLEQSLQQTSPDIAAAWMLQDGHGPPAFPPPLFEARPPKLSDPTGKDMLGVELALHLNRRLLEPSGTLLLKVCRGLWTLHGLAEQHAQEQLDHLDASITKRHADLQKNMQERVAVAGGAALHAAVQQLNQNDEHSFRQTAAQERGSLLTSLAWEFRKVLCTIQTILTQLRVPGFHGTSIDRDVLHRQASICQFLQSAFFLREKLPNSAGHIAMLTKQGKELEQEHAKQQQEQEQQPYANSMEPPPPPPPPSVNYSQYSPPPPPPPPPSQMYQQQQQQQQPPPYGAPPPPMYGQQQQQQQQQQFQQPPNYY